MTAKKNGLNIRNFVRLVSPVMKNFFTLAVAVVSMAAFVTSSFAGSCGSCPADGDKDKDKDKTEEGTQS